jgi:hypothetical protein
MRRGMERMSTTREGMVWCLAKRRGSASMTARLTSAWTSSSFSFSCVVGKEGSAIVKRERNV